MSQGFWKVDEIEVSVSGFFTTHHYFETPEGTWGEMTFPAFAQRAVFQAADGQEWEMYKTSWLGSAYELRRGDAIRGRADRPRLMSRDLVIEFGGQEYRLAPEGVFKMGWLLVDAEENEVAEFQPRGVFREGAHITVSGWVDLELVVFGYFLVHMRKQEEAAGAAAAAGAAS